MDKKTAALMGAAAAALAATPALAAPAASEPPVPQASSYSDLLTPIPNAVERLRAADLLDEARPIELVRVDDRNNHHHHHHSNHNRRWYRSHGYSFFGGRWVIRPARHDHHHNHHDHNDGH